MNLPTLYLGRGNATVPAGSTGANNPVQANYTAAGIYCAATGRPAGCPSGTIPSVVTQGGNVVATVDSCTALGFIPCSTVGVSNGDQLSGITMHGSITGGLIKVNFNEALGFIHSLPINSPFSLSLQQMAIKWPGSVAADIAQRGWWMSFSDPVNIGSVDPAGSVPIGPLFSQLQSQIQTYLDNYDLTTNDIVSIIGGSPFDVQLGNIPLTSPLTLNLNNLQLAGQNFSPNCWGSSKFC
jgi:hypothetical protein